MRMRRFRRPFWKALKKKKARCLICPRNSRMLISCPTPSTTTATSRSKKRFMKRSRGRLEEDDFNSVYLVNNIWYQWIFSQTWPCSHLRAQTLRLSTSGMAEERWLSTIVSSPPTLTTARKGWETVLNPSKSIAKLFKPLLGRSLNEGEKESKMHKKLNNKNEIIFVFTSDLLLFTC